MQHCPSVLIVDDDPTHRRLMEMIAQLIEIKPLIVENAEKALEAFVTHSFDIILMDWRLPEMDGCHCAQEMRRLEKEQNRLVRTPIIAVTAKVMPGDREICLGSGMDDYLPKPFTLEDMDAMVKKWSNLVSQPSKKQNKTPGSAD
jgi:CheY-like chemotaxis protein